MESLIASLKPVSGETCKALLAQYPPEVPAGEQPKEIQVKEQRVELSKALVPAELPQGLAFQSYIERDRVTWYLSTPDDYEVVFYQEDAACVPGDDSTGGAGRRLHLADNAFCEVVELAGQQVNLLGGEAFYNWQYWWEQDGQWCHMSIDVELTDQLGTDRNALAERIICGLKIVQYPELAAAFAGLGS